MSTRHVFVFLGFWSIKFCSHIHWLHKVFNQRGNQELKGQKVHKSSAETGEPAEYVHLSNSLYCTQKIMTQVTLNHMDTG